MFSRSLRRRASEPALLITWVPVPAPAEEMPPASRGTRNADVRPAGARVAMMTAAEKRDMILGMAEREDGCQGQAAYLAGVPSCSPPATMVLAATSRADVFLARSGRLIEG